MAICDWCGIREAGLVAVARHPKNRRPHLFLCQRCWDEKWSHDEYDAGRIPILAGSPASLKAPGVRPFHLHGSPVLEPRTEGLGERLHS